MKLEFSQQISEKRITEISNFMKIRPVGAELFHYDGERETYMTKLIVGFLNFANAPKKKRKTYRRK